MANDFAAPKKKKNKALLFGLVGVGLLATTIGGVFAANSITINGGGTIEFGQGLASAGTCDSGLTTVINQAYNATDDKFYASTIEVTGINGADCDGKTMHVSLIGDTDGLGTQGVVCSVAGDDPSGVNQDEFAITSTDTAVTVTIAATCDATTISKVAITTS
jgi:hypothetical protein